MSLLGLDLYVAHFGHWYISLPVYMAPVVLVVAWMKIGDWRERARARRMGEKPR